MKIIFDIIQTFLILGTLIATSVIGYQAWKIGVKQNEISDFVEIFVVPQQVIGQDEKGAQKIVYWNLLIKNASSYPVYLNKFNLSGVKHLIGNSAIPKGDDSWYGVPIPQDIQNKGELSLEVEFEDYLGKKYISKQYGEFKNGTWNIRGEKRELVK